LPPFAAPRGGLTIVVDLVQRSLQLSVSIDSALLTAIAVHNAMRIAAMLSHGPATIQRESRRRRYTAPGCLRRPLQVPPAHRQRGHGRGTEAGISCCKIGNNCRRRDLADSHRKAVTAAASGTSGSQSRRRFVRGIAEKRLLGGLESRSGDFSAHRAESSRKASRSPSRDNQGGEFVHEPTVKEYLAVHGEGKDVRSA
jgi:hypothetical protein